MGQHTIVLLQPAPVKNSRTFMDYESVDQAMDGICALFEKRLKEVNPSVRNITYDIGDLYKYLDALPDLSALVLDHQSGTYVPRDRNWIKQRAFQHLKRLANAK